MVTSDLWRVKPIDLILKQSDEAEHGLKRTLTAFRAGIDPLVYSGRRCERSGGYLLC